MSAAKHTPGLWEAMPIDPSGWVDIVVRGEHGIPSLPFAACKHFNQEANARLIAAAPELLEALRSLMEAAESLLGTCGCIRGDTPEDSDTHTHDDWAEEFLSERLAETRAAIAKATGEQA